MDPTLFTVDPGTLRASAWEQRTADGTTTVLHAYKAAIRIRGNREASECLHRYLARVKPKAQPDPPTKTFIFGLSDSQTGKTDSYTNGAPSYDGVQVIMDRFAKLPIVFEERWRDAKRNGADGIAILGLGDLIEGCSGHYPNQSYMTGLNNLEQRELTTDAVDLLIRAAASTGAPVTVAAVGGNHGERRRGAGIITDFADNDDIAIFRTLERAYTMSEKFPNVNWALPHHELHQTLDLSGTFVGINHGHNLTNYRSKGAWAWWDGMARTRDPIGQAHVLLTAHYHHFRIEQPTEGRTWIQNPAIETGSHWWYHKGGGRFQNGTVLTWVTADGSIENLNLSTV